MSKNIAAAPVSVQFVEVTEDQDGQRIDNFLRTALKGVPKSLIYRIVRKGELRVNKKRVKPDYKVQSGDLVRIPPIRVSAPREDAPVKQGLVDVLEAAILYEDNELIIINKPSGLAVHGGSGVSLGLIEALRQIRPEQRFLELVHRLDRDTSGCIMVAKKRSMLKFLHEGLRQKGRITKIYQVTEAAVDAFGHVDVIAGGAAAAVLARFGVDGNGLRRADRLAQFAGDAAFFTVRIAA